MAEAETKYCKKCQKDHPVADYEGYERCKFVRQKEKDYRSNRKARKELLKSEITQKIGTLETRLKELETSSGVSNLTAISTLSKPFLKLKPKPMALTEDEELEIGQIFGECKKMSFYQMDLIKFCRGLSKVEHNRVEWVRYLFQWLDKELTHWGTFH